MKPLTVLTTIRPGAEQQLTEVLHSIDADLSNNQYMRLAESTRTHFARFLIIHDPDPTVPARLLYACDHDGSLYDYIEEMLALSPGLDELWGTCEGYNGRRDFAWFIRRNSQVNRDVFVGFPEQSVLSIRGQIVLRQQLERFLDLKDVQLHLDDPDIKPLLDLVLEQIVPGVSLSRRIWRRVNTTWHHLGGVFQQRALNASLAIANRYNKASMNANYPRWPEECVDLERRNQYLGHLLALEHVEDRFVQNQMTIYAPIKEGLYYQVRLRIAMFLASYVITYGWPPGEFSGVYTLHSFNWLLLDQGRRLVFMSNFDNSPQNYLGDFLAHLDWGLNLFYSNCVGYPEGGMQQVDAFTQWIREHQIPPLLYYSAYPGETVLNIMRNQRIAEPIVRSFDRDKLWEWMRML